MTKILVFIIISHNPHFQPSTPLSISPTSVIQFYLYIQSIVLFTQTMEKKTSRRKFIFLCTPHAIALFRKKTFPGAAVSAATPTRAKRWKIPERYGALHFSSVCLRTTTRRFLAAEVRGCCHTATGQIHLWLVPQSDPSS